MIFLTLTFPSRAFSIGRRTRAVMYRHGHTMSFSIDGAPLSSDERILSHVLLVHIYSEIDVSNTLLTFD